MIFDMEDYMQSIVDDFEAYGRKLHGPNFKLRPVATPFMEEDQHVAPSRAPNPGNTWRDLGGNPAQYIDSEMIKQAKEASKAPGPNAPQDRSTTSGAESRT